MASCSRQKSLELVSLFYQLYLINKAIFYHVGRHPPAYQQANSLLSAASGSCRLAIPPSSPQYGCGRWEPCLDVTRWQQIFYRHEAYKVYKNSFEEGFEAQKQGSRAKRGILGRNASQNSRWEF